VRRLAAAALGLGAATMAHGQSASDYLPREPGTLAAPAPRAEPPAPPPPFPAPAADAQPAFVLRGVEVEGATALDPATLAPLWAPLLGQPVPLATISDLAERIGAAYRDRGYVLSQAVIPEQTIADGMVRVLVIEGFIDRVAVEGGTPAQAAAAARLFAPVAADRPLEMTTLERSVLLSRDTFAGSVETVLEPSPDTFGAADLSVLLAPERFTGFAAADNRGSRLYGPLTLTAGGSAYDLLGLNERIDALLALAPESTSLAYGEALIDLPLPAFAGTLLDGAHLEVSADTSHGTPDLSRSGSDDLTVTTDETNLGAAVVVPFIRTRSQNLFLRLGIDWQSSESVTRFAGTDLPSTDRLTVLRARLTWDRADRFGGVTLVDAGLSQGLDLGSRIEAEGPAAGDPEFTAGSLTLSRLQRLGEDGWSLYGEAIGQLAADVLPNSERFSLGNSTIGRGFAPGNTSGDSGWGARLELRRNLAGERLRGVEAVELYAFGDYGHAYDRAGERDGAKWEELGSLGIGARVDVYPWLTLTPEIARQTAGIATDTTDPNHETRFFIGAIARF
jgi:hemolysin activation/secretion protein